MHSHYQNKPQHPPEMSYFMMMIGWLHYPSDYTANDQIIRSIGIKYWFWDGRDHIVTRNMKLPTISYTVIIQNDTTGLLNAWIWLDDEHSKMCNYFQGNSLKKWHYTICIFHWRHVWHIPSHVILITTNAVAIRIVFVLNSIKNTN